MSYEYAEFKARRLEYIMSSIPTPETRSYLISFLKEGAQHDYFKLLHEGEIFDKETLQDAYVQAAIFSMGIDINDEEAYQAILKKFEEDTGIK